MSSVVFYSPSYINLITKTYSNHVKQKTMCDELFFFQTYYERNYRPAQLVNCESAYIGINLG